MEKYSSSAIGQTAAPRDINPDSIGGMITLLDSPINEFEHALARLRELANRLSGSKPEEVANGQTAPIANTLTTLFADKHRLLQRLTSQIHAEITRIDQAL